MTRVPSPTTQDNPEEDVLVLELPERGLKVEHALEYSYNEDFFTPTDGWHFTVAGRTLPKELDDALVPGEAVRLSINGHPQSTGAIDDVERGGGRSGGTEIRITGRDILAPVVDAHVDPGTQFPESQTIFDIVTRVLAPFGLETFSSDNEANLNVITGQTKGAPQKRRGLKSFLAHQLNPYTREGAMQFCARLLQRFGLFMWPDATGDLIIIGKVSGMSDEGVYTMPAPRYALVRREDGAGNNIAETGVVRRDGRQPACILASGGGGGGEFPKATLRGAIVNPLIKTDISGIQAIYPKLRFVTVTAPPGTTPLPLKKALPLYLNDDESHDQDQLDAFLRREMTFHMRRAVTCHYPIKGHSIGGSPVAVDTIADVNDDVGKLHQPMWIQGRTFTKNRGQGSTGHLTLILPGCVIL